MCVGAHVCVCVCVRMRVCVCTHLHTRLLTCMCHGLIGSCFAGNLKFSLEATPNPAQLFRDLGSSPSLAWGARQR